ncbi:Flp pilus assembly complex ATPase component TadA [Anaerobacillus sp. HL2]|nr:Flp pilus assembly complex ATPase component TadA [Anaerobacillus sp. HL2]
MLYESVARNKRIITIEDPVEKRTDAFIQVELNEKAGITYEEALKAALRHDPDIIMVGEIRDQKTAQIVVRASMTGHLVISTIHANNCLGCISRLREFGIAEHDIKETVIKVSQRLLELNVSIVKAFVHFFVDYIVKKGA